MSEKLFVYYSVEQDVAKKISLETGTFHYYYGQFEVKFCIFSKEVQSLIYEKISRDGDELSLRLTSLNQYYLELDRANIAYEKFSFTKEFFEGKKLNEFILHYFSIKEKVQTEKTKVSKKEEKVVHVTYLLDPDYVEAKKLVGEPIEQKQILSFHKDTLAESVFLQLAKHIKWQNDNAFLDLTGYDIQEKNLYASTVIRLANQSSVSNLHHFLLCWVDFFEEQKEGKTSLSNDKTEWIQAFGSEHLKRAHNMNYNCQRQYVTERVAKEYPDFTLDFDEQAKLKERPFPSEKALDIEETLHKNQPKLNVRVEWMQKPEKECEVVVISDYLRKYRLYKTL